MRYLKLLAIIILFFLAMVFFIQNIEVFNTKLSMQFNLFGQKWSSSPIPVYIYILVAFVIGGIVSMFYFLLDKLRQGRKLKTYQNQIKSLQAELNSLKNKSTEEKEIPESANYPISQEQNSI